MKDVLDIILLPQQIVILIAEHSAAAPCFSVYI